MTKLRDKVSKRVVGCGIVVAGFAMATISWIIALKHPIGDPHFVRDMIALLLGTGGVLMGSSLFDGFRNKYKK